MRKINVSVVLLFCCWGFSVGLAAAQPLFQRREGQFAPGPAAPRSGSALLSEAEHPDGQGCPWRREGQRTLLRQQREGLHTRLEHIRSIAERFMRNPSASDDDKAKAQRLLELTKTWEELRQKLDDSRETFFQSNQKDIDELCQLWERAKSLRQTLKEKREQVMLENRRTREDLIRVRQEVRDIAESIRQQSKRAE